MPESKPVDVEARLKELAKDVATLLDAFDKETTKGTTSGNTSRDDDIRAAENAVTASMNDVYERLFKKYPKSSNRGAIVIGTARALRDFINSPPVKIPADPRRPYPNE
jgi:hypothetical protein